MELERRLAAILAADVVGYSRLMGEDEAGTLARLEGLEAELLRPLIDEHGGRIFKHMGDGFLVEFASVVDAIACALAWQEAVEARADQVSDERTLRFRIGINSGDVIVRGSDIHGEGVNIAARLEALAEPGSVYVSRTAVDYATGRLAAEFHDLGEQQLKNIAVPVQVFRAVKSGSTSTVQNKSSAAKPKGRPVVKAMIAAVVLLLLAGGAYIAFAPSGPREEPASLEAMAFPLPDKPSIAVLPFDNMSEDKSQDYFSDGMTEDLITDLSKLTGLFVIARNSSFSYKGQQVKVRQVAEELGVRYVLEGSVRRAGNQVRINAQLIDATTGGHLWAERYDGKAEDIFELQDQVTAQIVGALKVNLTGAEEAEQSVHATQSVSAYDTYLQGWALYKLGTLDSYKRALPLFEKAIDLDERYAQAHAALASLYLDVLTRDWAFDLDMPSARAEERANEHLALALESPTPLAFIVSARMMSYYGFAELALAEAEQAVSLDANDAVALAGLARALIRLDRQDEALGFIERASRLDPHHPPDYLVIRGGALFGLERFEDSLESFDIAIERIPDLEMPRVYRAAALAHLDRVEEADDGIEELNQIRNKDGISIVSLRPISEWANLDYETKIDFPAYGGKETQALLTKGLKKIPLLRWQYLVDAQRGLGAGATTFTVDGAPLLTLDEAKVLYDRGAVFIDSSPPEVWKEQRVKGAINLPYNYSDDASVPRLDRRSLSSVAGKSDEIVFYSPVQEFDSASWEAAKALAWGYEKVHHFLGGARAWAAAGHPVEASD